MIKNDNYFARKYIKQFQKRYDDLQAKKEGYNVSMNMTENYIREQDFLTDLISYVGQFISEDSA